MIERLIVDARVTLTSPAAAGGLEPHLGSDRPILLDEQGRPAIPGSAVAGSLRSLLAPLVPHLSGTGFAAGVAFGALFGTSGGTPDSDAQGLLKVADLVPERAAGRSLRDGVGIDRASGAARRAIKYDYEVADHGATYRLRMELHAGEGFAGARRLLAAGLDEWRSGQGVLGARSGAGLGSFALDDISVRALDLADRSVLEYWLRARPGGGDRAVVDGVGLGSLDETFWAHGLTLHASGGEDTDGTQPGRITVVARLEFPDLLLVGGVTPAPVQMGGGGQDIDADARPIRRPSRNGDEAILPGSSLRGILRSRAERILRTLGGDDACCDPNSPSACGRAPALKEAQVRLEGTAPRHRAASEPQRAAEIRASVCPACRLFGSAGLGGRVRCEEAVLDGCNEVLVDHVATDRLTGGAADNRKFDAAGLRLGQASVRVTLARPAAWEVALVLLVLRDLCQGWVPVGSRVTRGYGAVSGRVTRIEVRAAEESDLSAWCQGTGGLWWQGDLEFDGTAFLGAERPLDGLPPSARHALNLAVPEVARVATARSWRGAS